MPDDQSAVIEFLSTLTAEGGSVERVDTHASIVFLSGPRALKLKRAVRYDYLDFSTPDRRRACCEAEVRINRRTAPSIYRGVRAITRQADGTLAIDGAGEPVDWVVEMARFDQGDLFDRLAERQALDLGLMRPLGRRIAAFHAGAEPRRDHGGMAGMTWVVDGNLADLRAAAPAVLDPRLVADLERRTRAALDAHAPQLDRRREAGLVRQCHGDLHLRNIVRLAGAPTLFDAVEFNDEIACTDVLYDLAFLLMDLWRRRLPAHANAVFNGYLAESPDDEGLALLPLFLSCRAAVRAKTSLAAAALQDDSARRDDLRAQARAYAEMAVELLEPSAPRVIAVGGFSGSGKSTLARCLAPSLGPVPGAVVLRSDEVRKQLCGVSELTRLGPDGYQPAVTEQVYSRVVGRAAAIARTGHGVIVDAVFARPSDRAAVEGAAAAAGTPFMGLWLDAPADVLTARASARTPDASDADAAVVRNQLSQDVGLLAWTRLAADASPGAVLAAARRVLDLAPVP